MSEPTNAADYALWSILDRTQAKQKGDGWKGKCPAHEDREPSLSIHKGADGKILLKCFAGCDFASIVKALGLEEKDLFAAIGAAPKPPARTKSQPKRSNEQPTYLYHNEQGEVVFGIVRRADKSFAVQHPSGDGWYYGYRRDTDRTIYRLPDVIDAIKQGREVAIVEGEKDADRLRTLNVTATTNPNGAGKWLESYSEHFRGADVIVIPDNDDPGRKHADQVSASLHGTAARIRIIELPNLNEKGDVSDWIDADGTADEFRRLADGLEDWNPAQPVESGGAVDKKEKTPAKKLVVSAPSDPYDNADSFVAKFYSREGHLLLRHHQDTFREWNGRAYVEVEVAALRKKFYALLHNAVYWHENDGEWKPFKPDRRKIADLIDALEARTHLPQSVEPPAWLDESKENADPRARELVVVRNGALHLTTRTMIPPTPRLFALNAIDVDYTDSPPAPAEWFRFLMQLWPDDPESITVLGEVFGYLLTSDTSQQKMFLLIGPKRSGKGTIARVLRALIGATNVAGPTLAALGSNFGLQSLIGRSVAIISDARLSGRADQQVIVERLLSITGEDAMNIDRKYQTAWIGQLRTRFLILTNELPRLNDSSTALSGRFITLLLKKSFYGKEDPTLTGRLFQELPGILHWSLEGLRRLHERGCFVNPGSSEQIAEEMEELSSPITAFVRDCCVTQPGAHVPTDELYHAWVWWSREQGRERTTTKSVFGRDLRAVLPWLQTTRPRGDDERKRMYEGLGLRDKVRNVLDEEVLEQGRHRWNKQREAIVS